MFSCAFQHRCSIKAAQVPHLKRADEQQCGRASVASVFGCTASQVPKDDNTRTSRRTAHSYRIKEQLSGLLFAIEGEERHGSICDQGTLCSMISEFSRDSSVGLVQCSGSCPGPPSRSFPIVEMTCTSQSRAAAGISIQTGMRRKPLLFHPLLNHSKRWSTSSRLLRYDGRSGRPRLRPKLSLDQSSQKKNNKSSSYIVRHFSTLPFSTSKTMLSAEADHLT